MGNIVVLKFGSSVLGSAADLPVAVDEIYRHVREGRRVVAVVSAFAGVTDRLVERANELGGPGDPFAYASLVGSGELESAAMLSLSLATHGIPARLLPPEQFSLRAEGDPLDARPLDFDELLLRRALATQSVAVVPGFVAHDAERRTVLLGRGGSDFTALFIAGRLGAECVLVKDVDGLYERDPATPGPAPRRYSQVTWDEALRVAGPLVQPKTIRHAQASRQSFRVTRAGAAHSTLVGPGPSRLEDAPVPAPLRVVLLGLGTVGRGVYERLRAQPARYEVVRALVRDPARHVASGIPAALLSTQPWDVVAEDADVVIEALGGEFPAADLLFAALLAGRHVVTANKAAVVADRDRLAPFATGTHPRLRLSAAVGGSLPVLETLARADLPGRPVSLRGVLNGTCNFVLDRVADGVSLADALAAAQAQGFAEPDPTDDVSGLDVERKLRLCAEFGLGHAPARATRCGIDAALPAAEPGHVLRLVGSLRLVDDALETRVTPRWLPADDFLAGARNEENRAEILLDDGTVIRLAGKGAGRLPTTAAVIGDLCHLARDDDASEALAPPASLAASG